MSGVIRMMMVLRIAKFLGFPGGSVIKNLPANTGDKDSVPDTEDPTCHWGNEACVLLKPTSPRAHAPQQEKPPQ